MLPDWFLNILYPLSRWLHIVGATLLVGGTLFYEVVMPVAVEDEKDEQQLGIFGRTRWSFGRIVWFCAIVMLLTGIVASARYWDAYQKVESYVPVGQPAGQHASALRTWWALHVGAGVIAIAIALRLTVGGRVPPRAMAWMRINFILLLAVIFFASGSRQIRINQRDKVERQQNEEIKRLVMALVEARSDGAASSTTGPATTPSTRP